MASTVSRRDPPVAASAMCATLVARQCGTEGGLVSCEARWHGLAHWPAEPRAWLPRGELLSGGGVASLCCGLVPLAGRGCQAALMRQRVLPLPSTVGLAG